MYMAFQAVDLHQLYQCISGTTAEDLRIKTSCIIKWLLLCLIHSFLLLYSYNYCIPRWMRLLYSTYSMHVYTYVRGYGRGSCYDNKHVGAYSRQITQQLKVNWHYSLTTTSDNSETFHPMHDYTHGGFNAFQDRIFTLNIDIMAVGCMHNGMQVIRT